MKTTIRIEYTENGQTIQESYRAEYFLNSKAVREYNSLNNIHNQKVDIEVLVPGLNFEKTPDRLFLHFQDWTFRILELTPISDGKRSLTSFLGVKL